MNTEQIKSTENILNCLCKGIEFTQLHQPVPSPVLTSSVKPSPVLTSSVNQAFAGSMSFNAVKTI